MNISFIDLKAQQSAVLPTGKTLGEDLKQRIASVLDHGQYVLGPEVDELESHLSRYVASAHCIAVSSGTDALLIALMALDISPGDEVITTSFSFIATAEAIALVGATPVFCDIDPLTYNIDAQKIEELITDNTRAIIGVSIFGQPADFSTINAIADSYNLPVIEDGAQSFGSTHHGKKSCGLTTIGITSFFPSKPLGCYGDGGACFTNDSSLAEKIRSISRHGQSSRYYHTRLGLNGRIDTIQAAVLLSKLQIFDSEIAARQRIASRYDQNLQGIPLIRPNSISHSNTSAYAQYTINIKNRDRVKERLAQVGIPTTVHYPTPICQQHVFKDKCKYCTSSCMTPYALSSSQTVLSLPMHPYLSSSTQDFIVNHLADSIY